MAGLLQSAVVLSVLRVEPARLPVGVGESRTRCDGRNPTRLGWKVGGEMSRKSIDHALLMALGLSAESAEIVMDEIDLLRAALLSEHEHLEQMTMAANQLHKELAEAPAVAGMWSLVAWPRTTGEGEEYLALPGSYETRAGAELAAEMAARIQKRTVMVVKRL